MRVLRFAEYKDKDAFRSVWDKCFNDSDIFSTWLFDNRFVPEYSVCLEEDGKIVCCIQSLPVHLYMRGKTIPSAIIMGVSTDPEYGGRGLMRELFTFYLNNIAEKGVILAPHTPTNIKTYYFSGAYPVNDVSFIEGSTDTAIKSHNVCIADKKECLSTLYGLYKKFYKNYSGIVSRSFSDFSLKADDYTVDGGLIAVHKTNGKIDGYSFFYDMDEMVYAEETVWENETAKEGLIKFISSYKENSPFKMKMPSDGNGIPRGVLNIPSISALLKELDINCDGIIEVTGSITEENNASFRFDGTKTEDMPHISMDMGTFTQLIAGYRSLDELVKEGRVTINDIAYAQEINTILPKQDTFIFDDY